MTGQAPRPIRVYWLTEAFYPPIVGGQELFASRLVQALAARGIGVRVITRQTEPPAPPAETLGTVDVRRIPPAGILKGKGWRAMLPIVGYLLRLLVLLIAEIRRFDVLIVSGAKLMPLVVVPLCALAGKKCIVRVESFFELQEAVSAESLREMRGSAGPGVAAVLSRLRNLALRRADCVIAISAEIRGALLARGVRAQRIRDIPNAVDLANFTPVSAAAKLELRRRWSLPAHRTLVIYAGRLSRAKGLPMLIEAWPDIIARHPELHLLLVGSGRLSFDDCEKEIRDRARTLGLEQHVTFAGESDRVHEYLQAADLFLFPTEYEGFSLALVEALACGLPVVVTAVGAAPDLVQDGGNGFLFPPKDRAAMARAIESALQQRPRWPLIGAAARESVAVFDLSVVGAAYLKLCHELTGSAP